MQLNEHLVSLRKEHGFSQAEVAEALNVSRQAVSKWESGAAVPSSENLIKLGKLYQVSIDVLAGCATKTEDGEQTADTMERELPSVPKAEEKHRISKAAKWILCAVCALVLAVICYFYMTPTEEQGVHMGDMEQADILDLGEINDSNFD